ncbi:MAG: hypothetical protein JXR36_06985 [Bacteroidales bacterium]|nr:hypothetical protein [Bacteroidales bacterium]
MKNKIIILVSIMAAFAFAFVSCDEELDTPPIAEVDQNKVLTIADIYQMYADSGEYTFVDDYMLYATVIMDDYSGNIYKEAYVQDSTGGINLYKLTYAESVKIGEYIRINLNGVKIVKYSGKMELSFVEVLDSDKKIVVQNTNVPITPQEVTIEDILTGAYENKLVEIRDVQFASNELGLVYCVETANDPDEESFYDKNRTLEDCDNRSIIVRTSEYASFAKDTVAQGKGNIIGVVTLFYQYSGAPATWQLLLRSIDEVNMDDERCI